MNSKFIKKQKRFFKKNVKSILVGVGVAAALIAGLSAYQFVFIPGTEKAFYAKYPEVEQVNKALEKRYPGAEFFTSVNWFTYYSEGKSETTSNMTVKYVSTQGISESEVGSIGRLACATLKRINKHYDRVSVVDHRTMIPFSPVDFYVEQKYTAPCPK